jgi:hypothetical protein
MSRNLLDSLPAHRGNEIDELPMHCKRSLMPDSRRYDLIDGRESAMENEAVQRQSSRSCVGADNKRALGQRQGLWD